MEQGDLEQQFQASLEQHVKKAGSVAGKEASGLLKEIAEEGALKLVKRYLSLARSPSLTKRAQWTSVREKFPNTEAFSDKVAGRGRPDLTLEGLIIRRQWRSLFEENELGEARRRQEAWEGRKTQSTSKELLETLRDGRPEESDDSEEAVWERKVRDFVRQFARSKETFGNRQYSELERSSPPSLEEWLDDYWAEEMLEKIPSIVQRTIRLDELLLPETCPVRSDVGVYMQEATRCYLLDLWKSSVAMARAALEQGLGDILNRQDKLASLIQEAIRLHLLNGKTERMARSVQRVGNDVLHGGSTTEKQALDTLRNARAVLIHLYTNVPS